MSLEMLRAEFVTDALHKTEEGVGHDSTASVVFWNMRYALRRDNSNDLKLTTAIATLGNQRARSLSQLARRRRR